MSPAEMSLIAKQTAKRAGFAECGIAPAGPLRRADYLQAWLHAGRAGTMGYMHRHQEKRRNPASLLPGARSVLVAAMPYLQPEPGRRGPASGQTPPEPLGRIARYAWGEDYHRVVKGRLFAVVESLARQLGREFNYKVCVDTAPLVEREAAEAAGVGWIGKNTMVLNRRLGSYFYLGEIITDLDMAPDAPVENHCGSCTACLEACPTGAFPAPYEMDASRCISYLTIENRGPIDPQLAPMVGDWLFGCDICQEVCPFNRDAPMTIEPRLAVREPAPAVPAGAAAQWSDADCRRVVRRSALRRAKPEMLRRNARMVLENGNRVDRRAS